MNNASSRGPLCRVGLVWLAWWVTALAGCGGGGGGGGGGTTPPPTVTLTVAASASSVAAGGQPVSVTASVSNSTGPVAWTLTGPGALSAAQGTSTTYAPPLPDDLEADGTATITATLGTLAQSVSVSLATSPGHTWQVSLYPKPDWAAAIYANGLYVVGGGVGTILRSTDAVQWNASYIGLGNQVRAITWGANGFVAAGFGGLLARSDDGATWTLSTPVGTQFSTP